MTSTVQNTVGWAFRSMIWVRKDIESEQIPVQSSDLTSAVIRLQDRSILVFSVYVEGQNDEVLLETITKLRRSIEETRRRISTRVDLILTSDFNRHDQL